MKTATPSSADPLVQHGAHVMTVCNACRYCEQYCPVFPAMEERATFDKIDLAYLANLCHNCGECLYACQYAPPHEFGINVPETLAKIRLQSYEDYAWPRALSGAFARHSLRTTIAIVIVMSAIVAMAARFAPSHPRTFAPSTDVPGDFYAVVPHDVMVALFGSVFVFAIVAMAIGVRRFARDVEGRLKAASTSTGTGGTSTGVGATFRWPALRDTLTLRHLHSTGTDCVSSEEHRTPWRRWFHHATFYGFLLCFASTSVAAIYHSVFGWRAPYDFTSVPVILGALGGTGLLIGSTGLWILRGQRDAALGDPAQRGLDESFIALLALTSLTGLALLALRHQPYMDLLLIVHLGTVLTLFVTLPYSKFVHGLYRAIALLVSNR